MLDSQSHQTVMLGFLSSHDVIEFELLHYSNASGYGPPLLHNLGHHSTQSLTNITNCLEWYADVALSVADQHGSLVSYESVLCPQGDAYEDSDDNSVPQSASKPHLPLEQTHRRTLSK